MAASRKLYNELADRVGTAWAEAEWETAGATGPEITAAKDAAGRVHGALIQALANDNPRFDRDRFATATLDAYIARWNAISTERDAVAKARYEREAFQVVGETVAELDEDGNVFIG